VEIQRLLVYTVVLYAYIFTFSQEHRDHHCIRYIMECDHGESSDDKSEEIKVVLDSNAIIDPVAVVIELIYAAITCAAVLC